MKKPDQAIDWTPKRNSGLKALATSVLSLVAPQNAGTVHHAIISGGNTLNIDLEPAPQIDANSEFWLIDSAGKKVEALRVIEQGNGRLTLTATLRRIAVAKNSFRLRPVVSLKGKVRGFRFAGNPRFLNGSSVKRHPLRPSDGARIVPAIDHWGKLAIDFSPAQTAIHLHAVSTRMYRVRISLRVVQASIETVECQLRGTDQVHASKLIDAEADGSNEVLNFELPLLEMASNPRLSNESATEVWRIRVKTSEGVFAARAALSDLTNPRNSVRYSTVVVGNRRGRHRFRPYWNVSGDLVIEHKHAVDTEGTV